MKQHVAHIAAWEASLVALLRRQSRPAAMGVPDDIWAAHEIDAINASIANAAAPETFESVLQRFHAIHGDTFEHYGEHSGWLRAGLACSRERAPFG